MPHNHNKIEMWNRIIPLCKFLSDVHHNIESKKALTSEQVRKITHFAFRFGDKGKKKLSLLAFQADLDADVIEQAWAEAGNSSSDTLAKCNQLCGEKKHCQAIRAIGREDPLELPHQMSEYDETAAAEIFCKYYSDRVLYHLGTGKFYEYTQGVWVVLPKDKLGMMLERLMTNIYLPGAITNLKIDGLVSRLQKVEDLFFEGEFNEDKFILNFSNGLYDLKSNKLLPHSPRYKSTVQFPVEYDSNADCPLFKEKMLEIFEGEQEVIDYVLKWMMYTLMPTYEFQKALLLLGKGGNGKSVLTDIWTALLGQANTSNQELGNLATDKQYSVFQLVNKYANFSREVSSLDSDSHVFKMLTGNDMMSARQIYGKPVDFRNKARLIISANAMPSFKTIDQAILRRFETIKFNRRFDQNADTLLSKKLIKELPGILNLVLEKSREIIQPGGSIYFDSPNIVSANLKLFKEDSDSVARFVTEVCEVTTCSNAEYATLLSVLYSNYHDWCKNEAGEIPKTKKIFKEEIEHLFGCNTCQVTSVKALSGKTYKNTNWVIGLRLKEPIEADEALASPIREKLGLPIAQINQLTEETNTSLQTVNCAA